MRPFAAFAISLRGTSNCDLARADKYPSYKTSLAEYFSYSRMTLTISVMAPVTGTLNDVKVTEGDAVSQGSLLGVQTMIKTRTQVTAPVAGRVKTIIKEGTSLEEGDILAEIEY